MKRITCALLVLTIAGCDSGPTERFTNIVGQYEIEELRLSGVAMERNGGATQFVHSDSVAGDFRFDVAGEGSVLVRASCSPDPCLPQFTVPDRIQSAQVRFQRSIRIDSEATPAGVDVYPLLDENSRRALSAYSPLAAATANVHAVLDMERAEIPDGVHVLSARWVLESGRTLYDTLRVVYRRDGFH